MKKLNVIAAGFGWSVLERAGTTRIAGLDFEPAKSVFPAVTCVAQAALRTGADPSVHGVVSNGFWIDALEKPSFWEQGASLVKGPRVWDSFRSGGGTVGLYFFQQSIGESVDAVLTPAPIHKHGGGMIMSCYTWPYSASAPLSAKLGRFPLWRYWGPLASPKVGRGCIDWFEAFTGMFDVDEAYLYLPTLDYMAQKKGPGSAADKSAFDELARQLERLADICSKRACELSVTGDYDIAPVTLPCVHPNAVLRKSGLFRVRNVGSRTYPDFRMSSAFAMCDHEVCILTGRESERAESILLGTGDFEKPGDEAASCPGRILLAKRGSWCSYRWWTDRREAPDFASHVDIHNKPGFDPGELFFFPGDQARGTHGRVSTIAKSEMQP